MTSRALIELMAAAERARTAYNWAEAIACYTEALALPDLSPEQLYELHDGRAFCCRYLPDYPLEYEDALAMTRLGQRNSNVRWRLEGLTRQAIALEYMGELGRCRTVAHEALQAANAAALPYCQARAQYVVGRSQTAAGEFEPALEQYESAIAIFEELLARKEVAECAIQIAFCRSYTGQDGRAHAQEAVEIARQLGDRLLEAHAIHSLGIVTGDDPIVALGYREEALEMWRTVRSSEGIASALGNIAVLYLWHGMHKRASLLLEESLQLSTEQSRSRHLLKLEGYAMAVFAAGNVEEGLRLNEQAINEARAVGREDVEAFARQRRGMMLHRLDRHGEGRAFLEEAAKMMDTAPKYRAYVRSELASVYLANGEISAAVHTSEEALQLLQETPDSDNPQAVYWFHYRALRAAAQEGRIDGEHAFDYLEKAYQKVVAHAAKLRDGGLRRAYLTDTLFYIQPILLTRAREAHARGEGVAALHESWSGDGNMEQRFKNLLAFSTRLAAEHEPQEMPTFILDEFVELSGAERAFLALRHDGDGGPPKIVVSENIDDVDLEAVYEMAQPMVEKALLARHAVLQQHVGQVPDGEPPAIHQRSLLVVPLVSPSRVMGVLYGDIREVFGPFTREDADLLTMLANHAAVALENAAWTQTLEQRVAQRTEQLEKANEQLVQQNAELAVINSVQRGLVARMDMQEIYELLGEQIREIFDAQTVGIGTFEQDPFAIKVHYLVEKGQRIPVRTIPASSFAQRMREEGRTFLLQTQQEFFDLELEVIEGTPPAMSGIFVPIIRNDDVWGMISLQNLDREYAFTEDEARLLETLAHSTSLALQNAQLFDETQRRAREMSALTEVGQDISSTLELTAVLERIASHARELLQVSDSAVFLPDETQQTMRAIVALGPIAGQVRATEVRRGEGIVGDLWRRREAEFVNDASHDPRAITIAGTERQPDDRMMVAPLVAGERVTGMMIVWRSGGEPFGQADLNFLQGLARQASIALENARLYSEAQAARAAAEAANASKSAFLANVSHELRTPLTSVLGFTRIVQKRLDERIFPQLTAEDAKVERAVAQVRKNLEIVLAEGERLTTLINNVLDLEKIESGRVEWRMEPLSLSEVVEQALQATSSIVEQAGHSLVKELPEHLPAVSGDRDKLVQVMINLISNAVKFTREGRISCCVRADDGEVRVAVSDTGMGIAPQDLDAVFEKFRQVGDTLTGKPAGTGLGLPICKEIVERHGGRIWVESVPGEGSIFQFTIPVRNTSDS